MLFSKKRKKAPMQHSHRVALEEPAYALFSRVGDSLANAEKIINNKKSNNITGINTLRENGMFSAESRDYNKFSQMCKKEIVAEKYIKIPEHPLEGIVESHRYNEIYDSIHESYITEGGTGFIYRDDLGKGLVKSYQNATKKNINVYALNKKHVEDFYNHISKGYITGLENNLSTAKNDTEQVKAGINKGINENMNKINTIEGEIRKFEEILKKPKGEIGTKIQWGALLTTIGRSALSVLGPFTSLWHFICEIGKRIKSFFKLIGNASNYAVFWVSLIFAIAIGGFSFYLFGSMLTNMIIISFLVAMYAGVFVASPLALSKLLHELSDPAGNKSIYNIIASLFNGVIITSFATSYLIITMRNRQLYGGYEQAQNIAATIIGVMPIACACIIGLMNFRRLNIASAAETA